MNDKELLVERLKAEGFAKSAEKVQNEPEQKNAEMKRTTPGVYNTRESE
ncbi:MULTISPECIES: hypothetical protein [Brevibacillus]|jgi:hypothetical protein|nr:hypothetical protein [Brevibacillus borstelensis]MBE5396412.1 hypothetical protein [Brevibacillus borstelensis]MCC0565705.1 hypothetical protein [Brevibacillus borstelensis]MCM3472494.1 hypothetical protein [Brevibacillus borstelensis]MCM3560509.1 hypothetical protein [Brevibacillus borstelensis]MCM3593147.1 hypothetical protein [Brevibacillus borstelensis]